MSVDGCNHPGDSCYTFEEKNTRVLLAANPELALGLIILKHFLIMGEYTYVLRRR